MRCAAALIGPLLARGQMDPRTKSEDDR